LRLLVPRRRRRRSLSGLALLAALAGCGAQPEPRDELALGITEPNPAFLTDSGVPEFERWRPAMADIAPAYQRIVVVWSQSVGADGTYDPVAPQTGCMRDVGPCAPWEGLRAQLEALPPEREVLIVPMYTPGADQQAPPDPDAYRAMVRAVNAEADRAGVEIGYWSPWNEPNHPGFLDQDRAPEVYVELAQVLKEELRPGQQLVLGELAGAQAHRFEDFVRALPDDLVCDAPIVSVHEYLPDPGDPVDRLEPLLDCDQRIWVTELGTRPAGTCQQEHATLVRYYDHPRVDAAFHYTLREDDLFRTGLVSTDLTEALPALDLWRAWGSRADPGTPPPSDPC
jgi:hypothetical protein